MMAKDPAVVDTRNRNVVAAMMTSHGLVPKPISNARNKSASTMYGSTSTPLPHLIVFSRLSLKSKPKTMKKKCSAS